MRPVPPNALSETERAELIEVLNSDRFADKAPRQVWAALLDEGINLASPSTMYRELRRRGPGAARSGPPRGEEEAVSGRPRPQRDLELGHHETARTRSTAVL